MTLGLFSAEAVYSTSPQRDKKLIGAQMLEGKLVIVKANSRIQSFILHK